MKGRIDNSGRAKANSSAMVSCDEAFLLEEDQVVAAVSTNYKARKMKKDASVRKKEQRSFKRIAPRAMTKGRVRDTEVRREELEASCDEEDQAVDVVNQMEEAEETWALCK